MICHSFRISETGCNREKLESDYFRSKIYTKNYLLFRNLSIKIVAIINLVPRVSHNAGKVGNPGNEVELVSTEAVL